MPSKLRLVVVTLLTVALVFQVFPVISIPVVDNIYLATYNGRVFGVFGWCSLVTDECTLPQIGYHYDTEMSTEDASLFLPSRAKRSISKLLIVHALSLFFTFLLWVFTLIINLKTYGHSRTVLAVVVLWSLLTVLLSLLSFLVDILLFVPYLAWPGWLILASTVLIAVASSIMCVVRRTVSVQKYEKVRTEDAIELYPLQFDNLNSNSSRNISEDVGDLQAPTSRSQTTLEQPELVHRVV